MKRNIVLKVSLSIVAVLLVMNLIVSLGKITATSYAAVQYQYKVVQLDRQADLQSALDQYSREGWEFVTHYGSALIFKRIGK